MEPPDEQAMPHDTCARATAVARDGTTTARDPVAKPGKRARGKWGRWDVGGYTAYTRHMTGRSRTRHGADTTSAVVGRGPVRSEWSARVRERKCAAQCARKVQAWAGGNNEERAPLERVCARGSVSWRRVGIGSVDSQIA
jgi:hypothetical protein